MAGVPGYLFDASFIRPMALLIDDDLQTMVTVRETAHLLGWRLMPLAHSNEIHAIRDIEIFLCIFMGQTASAYHDIAVLHTLAEQGTTAPIILLEDENQALRSTMVGDGIVEAGLNFTGRFMRSTDTHAMKENLTKSLSTLH